MSEEAARSWIGERYGSPKLGLLNRYVEMILKANAEQNLISMTTESKIWVRHILDSAQLAEYAPDAMSWLDVGSGAGLPGLVLAIVTGKPTVLVEPRRKRALFLELVADKLALDQVSVMQSAVERVSGRVFDAVTARAYAPLPQIFSSTVQLTHSSTIWILPKGRSAQQELDEAQQAWQGVFHVKHSLTDDDSRIVIATGVQPRCV